MKVAIRAWWLRLGPGLAWLAVIALALTLRLPHLVDRSLWYDEASSWQTASFERSDLFLSVRLNVHMPLYYLLLKAWFSIFGDSVVALRGFSVAFGVATVLLAGRFGQAIYLTSRICDESEWDADLETRNARSFGLFVALLVAFSPFQVLASIEARMYTLGSALAAASGLLLVGLMRSRGLGRLWWPFGMACLALAYTHHYGLLTVASAFGLLCGSGLMALADRREDEGRRILIRSSLTALIVGLLYLPGLAILRGQVTRVRRDYWIQPLDWDELARTFAEFVLPLPEDRALRPAGWLVLGLFAGCCVVASRRARLGEVVALGLAVGPLVLSAAASAWTPVWVPRYFRIAYPEMLAVTALAAFRMTTRRPYLRGATAIGLASALALANIPFWRAMDLPNNPGPRAIAEGIEAGSQPGEWVVVRDLHHYFVIKYYLRRGRLNVRLLKPPLEPFWGPHLIRQADLITPEELRRRSEEGLWIVGNTVTPAALSLPPGAEPVARLDATYHLHLHHHIYATRYLVPFSRRPAGDGTTAEGAHR